LEYARFYLGSEGTKKVTKRKISKLVNQSMDKMRTKTILKTPV